MYRLRKGSALMAAFDLPPNSAQRPSGIQRSQTLGADSIITTASAPAPSRGNRDSNPDMRAERASLLGEGVAVLIRGCTCARVGNRIDSIRAQTRSILKPPAPGSKGAIVGPTC